MNKDVISNFEHIYHLPTEDRLVTRSSITGPKGTVGRN